MFVRNIGKNESFPGKLQKEDQFFNRYIIEQLRNNLRTVYQEIMI